MSFKNYKHRLFLLVILLVILSVVLGWSIHAEYFHLGIIMLIGLIAVAILLITQVMKTNREILLFFKALRNDDTSIKYDSGKSNDIISELHHNLNLLNENFKKLRIENERREQFFGRILENLSSGIMIVSETGYVNHINDEALNLLNCPALTHIKALEERDSNIFNKIKTLRHNERSQIAVRDNNRSRKKSLLVQVTNIQLGGEELRVITVNDLSAELEKKEIEDWIRLMRILSHEIMNSLAPITSISTSLSDYWQEESQSGKQPPRRIIEKTLSGLAAIAEQSEGLTTFFESYRLLSRIPDPVIKEVNICKMFERLETLCNADQGKTGIKVRFICKDKQLALDADEQMIINVLLNMVQNSMHALKDSKKPEIIVSANTGKNNEVILSVEDNGPGIPEEIADEIFLPFFTTREKGSGVGLSYSRQVMNMHGGSINFDSEPGRTVFRLGF